MSNMTIYEKLNFINNNTNLIKQILVDSGLLTADEATLENLPIVIQELTKQQENPYQKLYMQKTANETNMKGLFAYTPASSTLDLSILDTSKATDMSYMFSECKAPYLDLSGFDTSKVNTMERMFSSCSSEINIDGWDTSKLTNASYMFYYFTNNNKYLDLSVLDFSNVTSATDMFYECNMDYVDIRNINIDLTKLPQTSYSGIGLLDHVKGTTLDLSNWILDSSMTDIKEFFSWCGCKEINITNWKTTNITNMEEMFYYSTSLERLIMPDWDMTNTTNTSSFFYNCSKLNYIDLSRSNDATIAKIATLVPAKKLATYGQILIPVDSSQENIEALVAKYWKPVGPRIDMTSCEIVTELDEIKPGKTTKLYYDNQEPWYGNDANVEYVSSDESIATIDKETKMVVSTGVEGTTEIIARIADTQEVISEPKVLSVSETDNYPNVIKIKRCSANSGNIKINGTSKNINNCFIENKISGVWTYDVGEPITSFTFDNSSNYISEILKFNTSNMTSMEDMLNNCDNLPAELDFSDWDTSNVITMQEMFCGCDSLVSINTSGWDTSKVTNTTYMFDGCDLLTELDLSGWNTSSLTNMGVMFQNCISLTELNISNFDLTNVTNIQNAFNGCINLHTLRLDNCSNDTISKIITSRNFPTNTIEGITRKIYCKQENIAGFIAPTNWIFADCESGEEIIPPPRPYVKGEFNNNNKLTEVNVLVTSEHTNLNQMFYYCSNLITIHNIDKWNTGSVTNMNSMFCYCESLTTLDVSSFDTSEATSMFNMFVFCANLVSLNLSHFNTSKVTDIRQMFWGCSNLAELDIRNFDMTNATQTSSMFSNCTSLHTLRLDNCSNDTINKIITSSNFPTNAIAGVTRKIYVKEANAAGLTPPTNWIFEFVD